MELKEAVAFEDKSEPKEKLSFVYFAAVTANLLSVSTGMGYAWPSAFIPKLNGNVDPENNPLPQPTTLIEDSWIASLQSFGAMFGPLFVGFIAHKIGKKNTLLVFSVGPIAANVIMLFANRVIHFYIARFLIGVSTGCVFSLMAIYIAEISDTYQRETTSLFMPLSMVSFQCCTYIVGPYVTIKTISIIALVPSILFPIMFGIFVPESPYQLLIDKKTLKAETALMKLRGRKNVCNELMEIKKIVETNDSSKISFSSAIKLKSVRGCLKISLGLMACQQFSGALAIMSYLQTIFDAAKSSTITGDKCAMLVGGIQVVTVIVTMKLINWVNRKKLLLLSLCGLFISLVILGGFFYCQTKNYNLDSISWLPIVSTCFYIVNFNFGIGSVPWTMVGEIFPANLRNYLSSISAFTMLFEGFVITLIFPIISDAIGIAGSMWMFAGCLLVAILFVITEVPETKGKTFQEIQELLSQ